MKKMWLSVFIFLTMWITEVKGQVLVSEVNIDTSLYTDNGIYHIYVYPDPTLMEGSDFLKKAYSCGMLIKVCQKKNGNAYDIYSFSGKIGSGILPDSTGSYPITVCLSRTFINEDPQWECLAIYRDGTSNYSFKLFDANMNVLLSDSGGAGYGFDGQNTYVYSNPMSGYSYKVWRFRTNVSSGSQNGLAKTAGSIPHAMMTFGPTGDYRITLAPASGGKTSVSLFDMLGRRVFSKDIGNLTSPVSFTIPESGVPPSPFVAKVQDEKGTMLRKEIPVR